MNQSSSASTGSRVVIAGGGIAAMEAALALKALAGEQAQVTVVTSKEEFVHRPQTVREPFAHAAAERRPLAGIVADANAELLADDLAHVDTAARTVHTHGGSELPYDALLVAVGARIVARYGHATTIDDRRMDERLHGIVQDVEAGYVRRLAFVVPPRMPWPLPLYEIALMTAGRAYDMGLALQCTIVTPEPAPLAIFGQAASAAVSERLRRAGIAVIGSGYAEVPRAGEVFVRPLGRTVLVDRVITLPELYGPCVQGLPFGAHGFLKVDRHCRLSGVDGVWAAGDVTDFPVKHGGIASQQADAAARSIAAAMGAPVDPEPFEPVVHGMLLTDGEPLYMTARITGGRSASSDVASAPTWTPPGKLASRYLSAYLAQGAAAAVE
jgi:sulfide:quinone oxidoreductase